MANVILNFPKRYIEVKMEVFVLGSLPVYIIHLQMQLCISYICLRAWLGWRATLFDSLGVALVAASWDTTELITVNSDNCSQTYSTRDHSGEGRFDF